MRILIRIVFVIFIANRIDCLGGVCDNCCDCFKEEIKEDEKEEIAISLINTHWYNVKKNNLVLKIFVKEGNGNVFISTDNKYKISIKSDEEGNPKIAYQNEKKDKLKLGDQKYAFFEIKTKEEETIYLYCSDVESLGNNIMGNNKGIFVDKDHESISVIACDTENITDMSCMFCGCNSLTELNLEYFNTTKVTNMNNMFLNCSSLIELDLNNIKTSNVTDMYRMFSGCSSLKNLDLNTFDTTNVTDMAYMFSECSNLKNLDISNFNTTNVTNMGKMFSECSSLTELNLEYFNTTNVTNMKFMFSKCSRLTNLKFGQNFNTSNVTDMEYMFYNCNSLTELNLEYFNEWNVLWM